MQDALEVRIRDAYLVHVVERVADIVDARAALADSLRHKPGAAVQVELSYVGRVRGIGEEGEGSHGAAIAQRRGDELRLVDAARHLAAP